MPERYRIEAKRDLTPEGYELALPLLNELEDLENLWTRSGDDDAYARWRTLLVEVQVIIEKHDAGPNNEQSAGRRCRSRRSSRGSQPRGCTAARRT